MCGVLCCVVLWCVEVYGVLCCVMWCVPSLSLFAQAVCYSKREPNIEEYWELKTKMEIVRFLNTLGGIGPGGDMSVLGGLLMPRGYY